MSQLNLPEYKFRIKKQDEKLFIFDTQRKKFVALTPEEWVRQHFIRFLIEEKYYPAALLAVEKQLVVNGMKKRCDAILYDIYGHPQVIIEFKAPQVTLNQQTFDQVAVYNSKLNVNLLIISNGLEHYCCKINPDTNQYDFFTTIPSFDQIIPHFIESI